MANSRALLLLGVLFAVACGCSSVGNVHTADSQQPPVVTTEEAQKLRANGLALYGQQPRGLPTITKSAHQLEQAARTLRDDYDAQWEAARALAFLAENETRPEIRLDAARRGVVLARQARTLKPDGVEGQYWYALVVGLLANEDRSYGLSAVGEMETALKRAIELDERYDLAGPPRVLGILQLRTPPPPTSIGSPRKALRLLQHAVELFPDYPENYLYLAEALRDNGRADEAREALRKVLEAKPWPDQQFESQQWKTAALKLRDRLDKP
jgi:tetratricopeptide (TPR) repeat protein